MPADNQTKDLSAIFGLDELSEEEREDFLADIGTTLMESAVLSFMVSLDEAGQAAFETFLGTAGEGEELMAALADRYPEFMTILEAEIVRFRAEAQALLGTEEK